MPFDKEALFANTYWHQKWEVMPGVFTPGLNDVVSLMSWAGVPTDLKGRRVLDIGAWNGCFSFECERRGAAEVVAIGPEPPERTGFLKLKEVLGSSRVKYRLGTIYDLQPERLGYFDVVICFGVIYHLRHPLLGFDMMRRVATKDLFLESAALDLGVRHKGQTLTLEQINPVLSEIPLMEFFRLNELNEDMSNWFSPNKAAVTALLRSSGFEPKHVELYHDRLAASATVIPGPPEWLTTGTGEGFYYDTITAPLLGRKDVY